ncbi:MAG TPA: Dyp-type peroxidase [Cytophagales bacterium]
MTTLELEDIQGIIARGYALLPAACYGLLVVDDVAAARRWLTQIAGEITTAKQKNTSHALNIGFTYPGLQKLGLPKNALDGFVVEYQEGMTAEHRQRILGDTLMSAPDKWKWGGPGKEVDIILLVFAESAEKLEERYADLQKGFTASGIRLFGTLPTQVLTQQKEHFGFHDGISQPIIPGLSKKGNPENTVAPGEFILGYENEYDKCPDSPVVTPAQDPGNLLNSPAPGAQPHDFGRNGSYLVFRQLSQDVPRFWQFMNDNTCSETGVSNFADMVKLAAKMVGRWPSGAPLVESPDADNPKLSDHDAFGYQVHDARGLKCPLGSHVRRTNPRDALDIENPEESVAVSKRHRLLRRARSYGKPLVPSMEPEAMLAVIQALPDLVNGEGPKANVSVDERGLNFMCFNANISRQFEFVQHTWVNNSKFDGLYSDPDPLIGEQTSRYPDLTGTFTIPQFPVRRRITGMPRFVEVVGGAYFFTPGIRAIRYLGSL